MPNTVDTRFGTASVTKGFTAVTTAALVERGALTFDTTARSVLGDDLPLVADDVTVEHRPRELVGRRMAGRAGAAGRARHLTELSTGFMINPHDRLFVRKLPISDRHVVW
jgi:CubicO group peptidase (beta-lactamase class C family)